MAEPPAKIARIDGAEDVGDGRSNADFPETEKDAPAASGGPKLLGSVGIHPWDTTVNLMQSPASFSADGHLLKPLMDGGFQYLLAGAKANVGVKSGRYMFEVRILELTNMPDERNRPMPKHLIKVGLCAGSAQLYLDGADPCIGFDSEGFYHCHEQQPIFLGGSFTRDDIVAVVLNLEPASQNRNTVSLFRNGVRCSHPMQLPDSLLHQPLYPTVAFKAATVHVNFGPEPYVALPFSCRMLQDADAKDLVETVHKEPKDGKCEVLFPVCLPEEGPFDWLDEFIEKNPQYTEISDRAILNWCEKSGIVRTRGYAARSAKDRPEMSFNVPSLDDLSIRRLLQTLAPMQERPFVVMEIKGNLFKDDRKEAALRWSMPWFKRVALVVVGEPTPEFKAKTKAALLAEKQEAANAEFHANIVRAKEQRELDKKQWELDRVNRRAERRRFLDQEQLRRRAEAERAAAEGREPPIEEPLDETIESDAEFEMEVEEPAGEPPKVSLTSDENRTWFIKSTIPDLAPFVLATSFTRFTAPEKDEGWDEVRYEWYKGQKASEHIKKWILERKLTIRVEDLKPSEWFHAQSMRWQKMLLDWHSRQGAWKQKVLKDVAEQRAKAANELAEKARREAMKALGQEPGPQEALEDAAAKPDAEKAAKEEGEKEDGEDEKEMGQMDFDRLDVFGDFGKDDIGNVGGGMPLFKDFDVEDWALLSLRFELHILVHAFRKDVEDTDRQSIHVEHLPFYYQKYFRKELRPQYWGQDTVNEVLKLVEDVIFFKSKNIIESALPEEMESWGVFVRVTEEARRNRCLKIDLGDESARLKLQQATAMAQAGKGPGYGSYGKGDGKGQWGSGNNSPGSWGGGGNSGGYGGGRSYPSVFPQGFSSGKGGGGPMSKAAYPPPQPPYPSWRPGGK
eukprot:TRINITY_DN18499_c0_g1_i1.p1 TRINITY_DN18499_c0_g1~~TRINITY_DN18499_c0_g1_i1.p1  ORF type:complete len:905 (-),score=228.58 TRINITY_DN18499_c0_g1_i1:186-2900(-)